MEKERIEGIDLLRIFAMLGIVSVHMLNHGGIINNLDVNTPRYYIINILLLLAYLSVNIFAMITGYLYVSKEKIKTQNLIRLLLDVLFYSIVITTVFYSFNLFSIKSEAKRMFIYSIVPALKGRYWYITSYILLFAMIPYINKLINMISIEEFKKMLIILFILLSRATTILWLFNGIVLRENTYIDLFHIENGYSPFWLMYCYLIGAYINKARCTFEKMRTKKIILLIITLVILTSSFNYLIKWITLKVYGKVLIPEIFISYISPFNVLLSSMILIVFTRISKVRLSKVVHELSKSSFDVYIVHSHILIYDYLIKQNFVFLNNYPVVIELIGILGIAIAIYLICYLIDKVKQLLFKIIKIDKLISKINIEI